MFAKVTATISTETGLSQALPVTASRPDLSVATARVYLAWSTHALRGLGLAMAEALAEVGATVILNGRDANTLKAAEGEGARARQGVACPRRNKARCQLSASPRPINILLSTRASIQTK